MRDTVPSGVESGVAALRGSVARGLYADTRLRSVSVAGMPPGFCTTSFIFSSWEKELNLILLLT